MLHIRYERYVITRVLKRSVHQRATKFALFESRVSQFQILFSFVLVVVGIEISRK